MISPCSFGKETRKSYFNLVDSPGPATYHTAKKVKSPGGVIAKEKRDTSMHFKDHETIPGPMTYAPQYHYVAKKLH